MRSPFLAVALPMATPAAAAGSPRVALAEMGRGFAVLPHGAQVAQTYALSGLLRHCMGTGEGFAVFALANMEHPVAVGRKRDCASVLFARNRLCAIAHPGLGVMPDTLPERMLDSAVRLVTSTPAADPVGDYAFALFAHAEALRRGARSSLSGKVLTPTGGPDIVRRPEGRDI